MAPVLALVVLATLLQTLDAQGCTCKLDRACYEIRIAFSTCVMLTVGTGTKFMLVGRTLEPHVPDNSILSLVGSSMTVTCSAQVLLMDTGLCNYMGCVAIDWVQNDTLLVTGSSTDMSLTDGIIFVSRKLRLNSLTWDNAGSYKCRIVYGGTSHDESFMISLSGKVIYYVNSCWHP